MTPENGKPSSAKKRSASRPAAPAAPEATKTTAGGTAVLEVPRESVQALMQGLRASRDGDFTHRVEPGDSGALSELARAFNEAMSMNERLSTEIQRVARVVGREGRMTERATMGEARGAWSASVEAINGLIGDLVQPTTEVARVIIAVAEGDLSQKMALEIDGRPIKGEYLKIGTTVNRMVDQLSSFASEVTRVAKEVGAEGKLGGQAVVPGVSGTWKDLTDNVNMLAGNLTDQVRNIAKVTTAVANGDLNQKITVEAKGEILELKNTVNQMVDQLSTFANEVTRVAREVGTEGKLGGQAMVPGVSGTWKDLTDNVNTLAGNLTSQVRNIALVTTAVANGDLSQKITVEAEGEILELKNTVNRMVDSLNSFAAEVTRVAREVGTEGKLGGQANVQGVSGTWKDLTENVNLLAGNLTDQVRNIALVTTAVANGDLTQKITVEAQGEIRELKDTVNRMVDQLSSFASEVTRVAREVGTEGKLGGQAEVKGVSGTWKDLTDNVNFMASNLTDQVRNIAKVTTAVANGDLNQKITVEAKGEILELKSTVNRMVDQLSSFAAEVTRVAKEVGTEGKLGGQANVQGVSGTWKDLTDNVNLLAGNLTVQLRDVSKVATAIANGDLNQKITVDVRGEILQIKEVINQMVDQLSTFAGEVTRVAREVGTEGKLGGQANVQGVSGTWKDLTDNVNLLAGNLTVQLRDVSKVATAIASGDLTQKITVDVKGEILQIKEVINQMVDQLSTFAGEVTRVAREVGTEGKLGGQANVQGVSGTWKDLTDNVNYMAANLTDQVRNIAKVTTAVANGDLNQKITVEAKGEILELKNTVNTMVDQLNSFAAEVTRVAREVGTEGKLGGQALVTGVSGTWKDLTDNVNLLAGNLTVQLRDVSKVATAIANGDLTQKVTVDVKGEILQIKNVINQMVDSLSTFAGEVTRVAKEVGTEGKLGGQAKVPGVAGTWKDLTDNVNYMASNLTDQVRNIALVTTAVANGDLSQKITVEAKGEILDLKETINTMVDQLRSFAAEVTRVAKEVGVEGKLGGQAVVAGVSGTWKDLTDNVNLLAGNLTSQVRNIALVTTAVANGDLSQKITVEAMGEILELKNTVNTMVDQLRSFAAEVTRVAKEVGVEGKLGGQAQVPGVSGTWKDLTDNVNLLAGNLTSQVRNIALVTTAVANGDLSQKITVEAKGEILELKNTVNTMVDQLSTFAAEVTRVAREVGVEGRLGGQAEVKGVSGTWKDLTDNVNLMASNLTTQVRGIVKVVTAVANGDLSQKLRVEAKGEIAALADTINSMTETLSIFADQVTTVAREVGVEGKLGGQAKVPGAAGTWKDLTDNVNFMAANLTTQVRGIVKVVTAVANGDLKQKLRVEAKGEIAALADTINSMTETLGIFADQVTTVAREVGVEGKLGGQARVPGAAGTWKDLTDNVNQLAANLTTQVRAIADVATAVTKGDLTRSITVDTQGELSDLKDNINQMIANLKETTQKNMEQDWLKTNLAKFSGMMQGQKNLSAVSRLLMSELTPLVSAHHGVFFLMDQENEMPVLKLISSYAYKERKHVGNRFRLGEGLVGQCALEKKPILLQKVPADYIQISSGLGESPPLNIVVLPVLFEGEVKAVIELASFQAFSPIHVIFLEQLMESLGVVLNMITANMRTEELLQELKRSNAELEAQAKELEEKATLLEVKNKEVELASVSLEEKAEQLALISKYKSEFLANMSHELRTPLNSLMILARLLAENKESNLTSKQVEFANTIYASGNDLLALINEILDLSKVESGKMAVDARRIPLSEISEYVDRTFRQVAQQKNLTFNIALDPALPRTVHTDGQRLQQVLRNLLSNAFKFTDHGRVQLRITQADRNIAFETETLREADQVLAFSVVDTGIGIPKDKQRMIFEAFQQADGTTSRKYGGTGLGLTISREIARLLGGEIRVESQPGRGSTFTLYLPARYAGPESTGTEDNGDEPMAIAPTPAPSSLASGYQGGNGALHETGPAYGAPSMIEPPVLRPEPIPGTVEFPDDRHHINPGDRVLLIVENDTGFARVLLGLAREKGLKGIVATDGENALGLTSRYLPDAITLDLKLPGMDGWTVLERLQRNPLTRHIPVHVISVVDKATQEAKLGALTYLQKPVSREALERTFSSISTFGDGQVRNLLIVEDDDAQRSSIVELLDGGQVATTAVSTGEAALAALGEKNFDCMILDLGLPDMDGVELLDRLRDEDRLQRMPVIIYTSRDLSPDDESRLRAFSESIIVKDPTATDKLMSETERYMTRISARRVVEPGDGAAAPSAGEGGLVGKKVLVVDDDVRNIFALASVLESYGLEVLYAENGRDGIGMLRKHPNVDIVLMDIMMPEMDGYETMREIRQMPEFQALPIISLTAKAMPGDREKCLEAGASDYIPKPVNIEQLVALMRQWLGAASAGPAS